MSEVPLYIASAGVRTCRPCRVGIDHFNKIIFETAGVPARPGVNAPRPAVIVFFFFFTLVTGP